MFVSYFDVSSSVDTSSRIITQKILDDTVSSRITSVNISSVTRSNEIDAAISLLNSSVASNTECCQANIITHQILDDTVSSKITLVNNSLVTRSIEIDDAIKLLNNSVISNAACCQSNGASLTTTTNGLTDLQTDYQNIKDALNVCSLQGKLLDSTTLACINSVDGALTDTVKTLSTLVNAMLSCGSREPPTVYDARIGNCSTGYILQDLNECATANGGCNQICNNTVGSYRLLLLSCWI